MKFYNFFKILIRLIIKLDSVEQGMIMSTKANLSYTTLVCTIIFHKITGENGVMLVIIVE